MNRKTLIIIIVAVIVVAGGILLLKYTFRGQKGTEKKKADIEITSSQLLSEFMEDETASNEKFGGKIIEVTGTIDEIEDNEAGLKVFLRDEGAFEGISCSMQEGTDVSELTVGKKVTIRGECDGILLDVILKRCVLVKEE